MAQVCRRTLNTVTAISGPVLFEIYPPLPFIVAGVLTTIWTIFLIIAFKRRERTCKALITSNILSQHGDKDSCVFHIATYPLQEILAQLIESKKDGEDEDDLSDEEDIDAENVIVLAENKQI